MSVISDALSEFEGDDCPHAGRTDQDLMGQKDKKQPVSLDHRKIDSSGRFKNADVRGYARMRKAMLEREKRLAPAAQGTEKNAKSKQEGDQAAN